MELATDAFSAAKLKLDPRQITPAAVFALVTRFRQEGTDFALPGGGGFSDVFIGRREYPSLRYSRPCDPLPPLRSLYSMWRTTGADHSKGVAVALCSKRSG